MDTSYSFIKRYVPDLDCTDQEYTDAMTLTGTKVEGFKRFDKNLEKIVVGQIDKIEKHPDADKLVVCQVNVGSEVIQIVTGASNMKEGDKVCVVLDGGKVAGGHDGGALPEDGIRIKKGKLRGVESFGMMCSIEELGSDRNAYPDAPESGLYILPADTQVGADAVEVLGMHDSTFEYEITSNRVDCYSVIGIAREAAATFGKDFVMPAVKPTGNAESVNDYLSVEVKDGDLCRRYVSRVVKNIKLAPSPAWMQQALRGSGFFIASEDLRLRGPGEILGMLQSGDERFRLADVYNDAESMKIAGEVLELYNSGTTLLTEEDKLIFINRLNEQKNGILEGLEI